jgi:tRNA 2-selenouridine synthase SelU
VGNGLCDVNSVSFYPQIKLERISWRIQLAIYFVSSHKFQSRLSDRKWKMDEIVRLLCFRGNQQNTATVATTGRLIKKNERIKSEKGNCFVPSVNSSQQ